MSEINLQGYMSSAIRRIMAKAYRNVLSNPREAKTVFRLQNTFIKSESQGGSQRKRRGSAAVPYLLHLYGVQPVVQRLLRPRQRYSRNALCEQKEVHRMRYVRKSLPNRQHKTD